ncbi:HelD family protein [Micromonospora rubida]|uniref:HelD family protein n=1 Tax=Micromonospora rubida TaxID=2697657 RepID=UPI0013783B98|nr:ATP-binding domain-containing protein [Micromonospora rubida]NBE79505.1 ATP-binding domain-containing protein [Micromonospora rubida]
MDDRVDRELAREQAHLAATRAALARMRDTARHRVATGADVAGDRWTAETLGRMLRTHAKELAEEPDAPPYFGRLRFGVAAEAGEHAGQRYHLGRRHITDEAGHPLVIDWRAPVSRTFYRATARDHLGVAVRRRYGWSSAPPAPARLTGFEDEHLDRGEELGGGSRLVAAEIERPRIGPMRDIVATIQPEQDELVRAGLDTSVCVQGAPGTGKTAVGLHRAAWLLYTHRRQLGRTGVLVIGPNPAFLRYVSAVLPALGEVDVDQRTLEDLLARHPIAATVVDDDAAAAVKHDIRMAAVLDRALYGRLRVPAEALTVPDGSYRWRLPAGAVAGLVAEIRRESPPYGIGRERLRSRVVGLLQRQAERRVELSGVAWARRVGRCAPVRDLLDRAWPAVRPEELLARLLGDPDALAEAADGTLTADEQNAVRWTRPRGARTARWSVADLVLLDEVAGLIEHPPGYGHVIVDEAQDLSPMQCRALARRSVHGSLTVLGDLAQGTTPWAARSWPDQLTHLGRPTARVVPLTAGFRVPGAVLAPANRLLGTLGVDVPPTRSVRADGHLRVHHADDLDAGVLDAVREALGYAGSVAVIGVDAAVTRLAGPLRAAGVPAAGVDEVDPSARVTLLPVTLAKGLEYDHVVLVEPADIVAAEARGPHRLYVALTRAVSRLDIVHHRPLPAALRG